MCVRSTGMPYLRQTSAASRAEAAYSASVKSCGRSTKPSCSMPTLRSFIERLPEWKATSSSRTICSIRPSWPTM